MDSIRNRLLNLSIPEPNSGCWLWLGFTNPKGYGMVSVPPRGTTRLAHRVSYALFVKQVPDGLSICHKCDTPSCINPAHLFIGSQRDNVVDMLKKGRAKCNFGEANGRAKLDADAIAEIRKLRSTGAKIKDLAKMYGVHIATIGRLMNGTTYLGNASAQYGWKAKGIGHVA